MSTFVPTHPGEILLTEFLEPMGISPYRIAKAIDVPPRRINEIVYGKRGINADTALRLSRALGRSDMFFINMSAHYDAEIAPSSWRPSWPASNELPGGNAGFRAAPSSRRAPSSPRRPSFLASSRACRHARSRSPRGRVRGWLGRAADHRLSLRQSRRWV
jgi:addiction module HigA family antidote